VHALGTPYRAVISGMGGWNVWSNLRVISRQFTSLMWQLIHRLPCEAGS
jgi:hypothetical protein